MLTGDSFVSARLKLSRAIQHLDELRRLTSPFSKELHFFGIEKTVKPPYIDRATYSLVYRPKPFLPERLSLIIGDTVHNLRSALDHLATTVVRQTDPTLEVHFPIRKDRRSLETPDKGTMGTLDKLETALPGSKELLLRRIRPPSDPYAKFWAFHSIDNADKHNLLTPVITIADVKNMNFRLHGVDFRSIAIGGNAAKPFDLISGSEEKLPFATDTEIVVDLTFDADTPFEGDPVVPTLDEIVKMVTGVLDAFSELADSTS